MTDSKEMQVTGTVTKLVPWASGKGYFFGLESDADDYYGYKNAKFREGDTISFTCKKGTGNFAAKTQLVKLDKTTPGEPQKTPTVNAPKSNGSEMTSCNAVNNAAQVWVSLNAGREGITFMQALEEVLEGANRIKKYHAGD